VTVLLDLDPDLRIDTGILAAQGLRPNMLIRYFMSALIAVRGPDLNSVPRMIGGNCAIGLIRLYMLVLLGMSAVDIDLDIGLVHAHVHAHARGLCDEIRRLAASLLRRIDVHVFRRLEISVLDPGQLLSHALRAVTIKIVVEPIQTRFLNCHQANVL